MLNLTKSKTRREFLKDGLRAGAAGSIVFMGLFLGWRGKTAGSQNSKCAVNLPCRDCTKLKNCTEPSAVKQKKTMESKSAANRNGGERGGQ